MSSKGVAPRIVIGVSGGIAAFKAVSVVRLWKKAGWQVQVLATPAALGLVGKTTWEAISGNPVYTEITQDVAHGAHVELAREADAFLVLPATANTIAKLAMGMADNMLTATALVATCPKIIAPAMHTQMWEHPATRRNLSTLQTDGWQVISPVSGELTSGDSGMGRLPEPEEIFSQAKQLIGSQSATADSNPEACPKLKGKRVIITAGGTSEPIDPVRVLTNLSTGTQGIELAKTAKALGAEVELIYSTISVPLPAGIKATYAGSARDLLSLLEARWDQTDVLVMAAAVADWRPAEVATQKMKKGQADTLTLELVRNPDILATLGKKPRGNKILVGFAAETAQGEAALSLAREKVAKKRVDLLALNQVGSGKGFGNVENQLFFLDFNGQLLGQSQGSKATVSQALWQQVNDLIAEKESI
ncbi:hypothetical protein BK816_04375 [Boudabousia tangfeifanii]|uniref:Coenzyme A biosynthesis bifunctional protein CoaBC n=1 Tax=Boudabousia tangfeifanii TaxID=1912795 RepID=A0A1D9MK00_9ACTO|nr:bifunctional phosphopantothenoylcysteine decarboxylase/phosphopantothenate--cysteine ligase CoaBC [Boudabousia tangfeifanii]AOZ72627.1 hypothetical protein BK816_04375 [Boudabousia tangfeifanii]